MILYSLLSVGFVPEIHFSSRSIPVTSTCVHLVSLSPTVVRFFLVVCLKFANFSHGHDLEFYCGPLCWPRSLCWYEGVDHVHLFRIVCGMSGSPPVVHNHNNAANVVSSNIQLSQNEIFLIFGDLRCCVFVYIGRCHYLVGTWFFTLGWLMFSR